MTHYMALEVAIVDDGYMVRGTDALSGITAFGDTPWEALREYSVVLEAVLDDQSEEWQAFLNELADLPPGATNNQ